MMVRQYYIDGIKGIAIVSVILLHAFPKQVLHQSFAYIHIWQAVPSFVFVSFFLIFRKLDTISVKEYYSWSRWKILFRRIIFPFMLLEMVVVLYFISRGNWGGVKHLLFVGGIGKGSYYPYLYCQIWLFSPVIWYLLKINKYVGGVFLVLLTIFLNYMFVDKPGRIYSCLLIRYLFMAVISYIWYIKNSSYRWLWFYILPLISIFYWGLLESKTIDLSLLVPNWNGQQFPAFFYTLFFVYLIFLLYKRTGQSLIKKSIEWLGKNSYEIFLMQMLFFYFCPQNIIKLGINIDNHLLNNILIYPAIALIGSIVPVIVYKFFKYYLSKNKSVY